MDGARLMQLSERLANLIISKSVLISLLVGFVVNVVLMSGVAFADSVPLPQEGDAIHKGVASCASSVCHGAVAAKAGSNVLMNEYRTWSLHDRHARAYKTLLSDDSKLIAKKLGLENAHEAKVCLDCHSDNVPSAQRGRRFQLSDGVGCEACHGGAELWIKTHTEPEATHASNLSQGMYPTEDPALRSQLCLSCHLGTHSSTLQKLASHDILGAGHPRLSFELDTFTILQPEHYVKDADYAKRKPDITSPQVWASGQAGAAQRTLELLASKRFHNGGMFPEVSFYDCHSCHHPMNKIRWSGKEGLAPGSIRLNDAYLQMTGVLLAQLLPAKEKAWISGIKTLQLAAQKNVNAVSEQAKLMLKEMPAITARFKQPQSQDQQKELLKRILLLAQQGEFSDYTTAEQVVMACSVLFSSLSIEKSLSKTLDALYEALGDEHKFQPNKLQRAAASALKAVERQL